MCGKKVLVVRPVALSGARSSLFKVWIAARSVIMLGCQDGAREQGSKSFEEADP